MSMSIPQRIGGVARAALLTAAVLVAPHVGAAATVTATQLTPAELGAVVTQPNPSFDATTGTVFQNVAGSVSGVRRSPFDTATGPTDNRTEGLYSSVGARSSGTFLFDSLQSAVSLIWGSPDVYNTMSLFLGGTLVAQVIPGVGDGPAALQRGAFLVTVSDTAFDRVVISSRGVAFEFANFSTEPLAVIPLPPAGMLLLAGIGGLALVGRRRRAVAP
jgi:hypothetical protein